MNKLIIFSLFALLFSACQNTGEQAVAEQENIEEEGGPLYVKDILKANSAVKIGGLQSKLVKQNINCTGRIEIPYFEIASIHSKSSGFIESKNYIPGDFVKKGTTLFTIVNSELIEKQRILLETKAELEWAKKEFNRKQILKSGDATSQKTMDEVLARKDLLTAKYTGLKSELEFLGIDLKALEEEQKFQSRIPVFASKSGYIHEVLVNNGQMVHPQDRLMEIANNDHVHVELQVLSKDVPLLEKGQQVRFTLPNNPQAYTAKIEKLNPMIDSETGTLNVHCHIGKGQEKAIVVGMFVNAEIEVEAREVKGLNQDAVIKQGTDYFAYVVEGEMLQKQLLENVELNNGFVSFENHQNKEMVISGAYYVE